MANFVASMLPSDAMKRSLFNTINNKEIGASVLNSFRNNIADPKAEAYRDHLRGVADQLSDQLVSLGHNEGWVLGELQTDKDFFINNLLVDTNLVRTNPNEFIDAVMNTNPKLDRDQISDLAKRIGDNMTFKEIT